jgi:hypothetical protein
MNDHDPFIPLVSGRYCIIPSISRLFSCLCFSFLGSPFRLSFLLDSLLLISSVTTLSFFFFAPYVVTQRTVIVISSIPAVNNSIGYSLSPAATKQKRKTSPASNRQATSSIQHSTPPPLVSHHRNCLFTFGCGHLDIEIGPQISQKPLAF